MKKILALVLSLALVGGLLSGCGPKDSVNQGNTPPQQSDVLNNDNMATGTSDESVTIAITGEPTALLTNIITSPNNSAVSQMIYDTLVMYNGNTGEVEPCLAESWEMLDETTWRFHIREGVVGHDGTTIDANDVYYSFKIGVEGGLSFFANYFDIEKFQVVDDNTIDIATKGFQPDLETLLCVGCYVITSQEAVEACGSVEDALRNPTGGSGKYKFVEWVPGEYITLERNDEYWGTPGYFKTVKFVFISDTTTRLMSLQSGDVDVAEGLTSAQAATVEATDSLQLFAKETLAAYFILFNCEVEGLDDVRVRQAIAYAIDRNAIWSLCMQGYGGMTDTTLSTLNPAYVPSENGYYEQDVEKAKELLAEAGYSSGLSLRLSYSNNDMLQTMAEMLQRYLGDVGIEVSLTVSDGSTSLTSTKEGDFDIQLSSASAYMLSRGTQCLYGGTGHNTQGWTAWKNQEFDAAIDGLGTLTSLEERGQALADAFELVREEVPIIGLFNGVSFAGTRSDIAGIYPGIQGDYVFKDIGKVAQ